MGRILLIEDRRPAFRDSAFRSLLIVGGGSVGKNKSREHEEGRASPQGPADVLKSALRSIEMV